MENNRIDLIKSTDIILKEIIKNRDFDKGFDYINELYGFGEATATSIAKALNALESIWKPYEHNGLSFVEAVLEKTRLKPVTIRNRMEIAKMLGSGDIPEEYLEPIEHMNRKSLIEIKNLWANDEIELEEDDWKRLSECEDENEVGALIRIIKNKPPRTNATLFEYDKYGNVFVWVNSRRRLFSTLSRGSDKEEREDLAKAMTVWSLRLKAKEVRA